jgi:putative methionine-R-sulfoxide reductase with GAF domain
MDHPPLNRNPSSGSPEEGLQRASVTHAAFPGISAGIAASAEHMRAPAFSRPQNDDAARSLAEIASRDLDAALQLLAERAQYITDASGAAIALRRGEHNDMVCRASAGSNAPELGAILSMRYGLSGESVRSGQLQRCDDAQNDPRVNREACLQLGIASVIVMPILSGEQTFGVFELFSGKPFAFADRDVSALQRLSAMVELAVRFAVTAEAIPQVEESDEMTATQSVSSAEVENQAADSRIHQTSPAVEADRNLETPLPSDPEKQVAGQVAIWPSKPKPKEVPLATPSSAEPAKTAIAEESAASNPRDVSNLKEKEKIQENVQEKNVPVEKLSVEKQAEPSAQQPKSPNEAAARKPLFWTAPVAESSTPGEASASNNAPPTMRNLQKCQACGFPVSQGRLLCVECEEKKWRGQPLPRKSAIAVPDAARKPAAVDLKSSAASVDRKSEASLDEAAEKKPSSAPSPADVSAKAGIPAPSTFAEARNPAPNASAPSLPIAPVSSSPAPFLASAVESQSWLAANKYILITLLIVAVVIAAIAFLR